MKTVWKYELALTDLQHLILPENAEILKFDTQYNIPVIWVLVDTEATDVEERVFRFCGTGHPIAKGTYQYIDTIIMADGGLVWHLFEVTDE